MSQQTPVSDRTIKRNQLEVLSIAEGFLQSSVLFALLKLRIFESIDGGSKTVQELAMELHAQPETLARLLNAGVVLKLLESNDGVNFRPGPGLSHGTFPFCWRVLPWRLDQQSGLRTCPNVESWMKQY